MDEKTMREIDTEAPVVWPAWCYSGKNLIILITVFSYKERLNTT